MRESVCSGVKGWPCESGETDSVPPAGTSAHCWDSGPAALAPSSHYTQTGTFHADNDPVAQTADGVTSAMNTHGFKDHSDKSCLDAVTAAARPWAKSDTKRSLEMKECDASQSKNAAGCNQDANPSVMVYNNNVRIMNCSLYLKPDLWPLSFHLSYSNTKSRKFSESEEHNQIVVTFNSGWTPQVNHARLHMYAIDQWSLSSSNEKHILQSLIVLGFFFPCLLLFICVYFGSRGILSSSEQKPGETRWTPPGGRRLGDLLLWTTMQAQGTHWYWFYSNICICFG